MKLIETPIAGAWLIEIAPIEDERGFFARSLCIDKLTECGLEGEIVQQSISFNKKRGTLRGVHYQLSPHEETKLVRVTSGRIFDVIVDLRPSSPSYLRWHGVELSAQNHLTLYIPKGLAHGFQTLEDNCEVFYQMAQRYAPASSAGVRWDDPTFKISWPMPPVEISSKDLSYAPYVAQ